MNNNRENENKISLLKGEIIKYATQIEKFKDLMII